MWVFLNTIFYIMAVMEFALLVLFTLKYKLLDTPGRCIYFYIIIGNVFAIAGQTISMLEMNNLWIWPPLTALQLLSLSIFYYLVIERRSVKRFIKISAIPMAGIFVADYCWWHGPFVSNTVFLSIAYLLPTVYGAIFILQFLHSNKPPAFWFNAGIFIFFCGASLFPVTIEFFSVKEPYSILCNVLVFIGGMIQPVFLYIGLRKIVQESVKRIKY